MDSIRNHILLPTVIVITLALAPVLAACSSPLQNTVDQGTGTSSEPSNVAKSGGAAETEGATLPDDFPKDVPIALGRVIKAGGIENPGGHVWVVTIQVSDLNAMDGIAAQLTDAGFSAKESPYPMNRSFDKGVLKVVVQVYKHEPDGFVAMYTVTRPKSSS